MVSAIRRLVSWNVPKRPRRVPVRLQLAQSECGLACLAMILSAHGRQTSLAGCRELLEAGRDGQTAGEIAEAARKCGLLVRAYSLDHSRLGDLQLPAVLHWDFNHFVVLERCRENTLDIVDPAMGRRRMTAQELAQHFTGVALEFAPGAGFSAAAERAPRKLLDVWSALRSIPTAPGLAMQVLLASLLLQALGLVAPVLTKVVVDNVLLRHAYGLLPVAIVAMIALILAQPATTYLRSMLLIQLETTLDSSLMLRFFDKLMRLPFRFFQRRTSGDLLMRLGSNLVIREILSTQTISAMLDAAFITGYLLMLFAAAPLYGAVVLAVTATHVLVVTLTSSRLAELVASDLAASSRSQSYLAESLRGIAMLKASGAEDRTIQRWSNLFRHGVNVSVQRKKLAAVNEAVNLALRVTTPVVLLYIGARQVMSGELTLGSMLALGTLALSMLGPLATLLAAVQQIRLVSAHLDRVMDVMNAAPEQDRGRVQAAARLSGRIVLDSVSFRYDGNGPWALRDISLVIEPGQKVAFVGRSGSGKSTLMKVIMGLCEATQGTVRLDGIPLPSLDYQSVRRQLGIVMQEPTIFSGSIRKNIDLIEGNLPLQDIVSAAQTAAIHADIAALPMGYETVLQEGGSGLSGGQQQRIALARALVRRPRILILDEATSNLDLIAEREVEKNLSALAITRLVVAHRLSTLRSADLIVVMESGAIVESGKHDELAGRGGAYAQFLNLSSAC